jgi:NAD(P)-dependent dehydrogenase (short-subunit alcohol dehydrogenase family)
VEDKTIVITGASDGIGAIAARELHKKGASVVIIGRSPEKLKRIADELGASYYACDFAKLEDVRQLAAQLKMRYPQIDVLINNAGGIFGNRELTVDGHEKTFQVNHLASFLLTNLLMQTLISNKASIINTSSIASHRYGNIDINDLDLQTGFSPNRAYGNTKLANILFAKELHRRFNSQGISAVAVHPGVIATNFANDTTSFFRFAYRSPFAKLLLESPERGAEPLIWLASSVPGKDWQSGEYYEKHKIGKLAKQANDTVLIEKFWELSAKYTAIP